MTTEATRARIFTYEEAQALLPRVMEITREAVDLVDELLSDSPLIDTQEVPDDVLDRYNEIVDQWAGAIIDLGIDVKGLWLVDFDCGSGYYCWKHPEPALQYFHGYDEGFKGRVKLN